MALPTEAELRSKVEAKTVIYADEIEKGANEMIRRAAQIIESNPEAALKFQDMSLGSWSDAMGLLTDLCKAASAKEPGYSFNHRPNSGRGMDREVYFYRLGRP
jgi:hypothetical protein